jgi:hypothetical protein
LTVHDLLGGELLIAEVLRTDGSRQGVHYWNLLPDGTEIDLTREQFASNEVVQEPLTLVKGTRARIRYQCEGTHQRD